MELLQKVKKRPNEYCRPGRIRPGNRYFEIGKDRKRLKMRDIKKNIEEYNKKFGGNTGNGAFYATDLMQIKETAEGERRGDREFVLISNALRAGFMIGYRKGKADARKAAKG